MRKIIISAAFITLPLTQLGANCTPQQAASADTVAIDLTNAACAIAEPQPAGQPWVDIVCTIAQAGEGAAGQVIAVLETSQGDGGTSPSPAAPALKTVRIRMPAPEAPGFLASHKGKRP